MPPIRRTYSAGAYSEDTESSYLFCKLLGLQVGSVVSEGKT